MAVRKAFEQTTVPHMKTLGQISGLVIARFGAYAQFQVAGGFAVEIGICIAGSKKPNVYRFVQVADDSYVENFRREHPKVRKSDQEIKTNELDRRARALFYYLKGMFEIVDLGYADLGQLMMGHLKLQQGRTLHEVYGDQVEKGALGGLSKDFPLALGSSTITEVDEEG